MEPHVYEVSALAYKGLSAEEEDQSILVSGESGAGKTETVKICLNHIASVSSAGGGYHDNNDPTVQRVVESNPLLEAFGNAKTRRNDNSSRFGKYLQLQFDRNGPGSEYTKAKCSLVGSKCDVYLLEKNRVVQHDTAERNFHIFYQLLAASDNDKCQFWQGLRGTTNESFKYVGTTDTDTIEGMKDADRFKETLGALELVNITGDKLDTLLKAICIVLQLGNLGFQSLNGDADKSTVSTKDVLKALSDLMGVSCDDLTLAMTERTFKTAGETHKVPLTAEAAKDACDALAKEAYQKAFLWLVRAINEATTAEEKEDQPYGTIGLLDIFGFESFAVNGFEQLCINYANEKLQQKFTEDIFKNVQAEYEAEGIDIAEITYDDNTDVLDLIEGRTGLLNLLNEECIRPKGNDFDYVQKSLQINKNAPCLIVHRTDRLSFGIQHYAGEVMYDGDSFVSKNLDTLPTDLQECAEKCSNAIISQPRSEPLTIGRRQLSNIVAPTVWTKYKTQLTELMTSLRKTKSRYIRCIKPNSEKAPLLLEHNPVVEQLRCAGVVAGITITRSVFPNRLPNSLVLARFSNMWDVKNYPSSKTKDMTLEQKRAADCKALLDGALKCKEVVEDGKVVKAFVVGKTKTYFRSGALEFLESNRMSGLDAHATVIQRAARGWLSRNFGKRSKQRREEEEAARRVEQERRVREREALREARNKELQALHDEATQLEKALYEHDREKHALFLARERIEKAKVEIELMEKEFADGQEEEAKARLAEKARQKKKLDENIKIVVMLKREKERLQKAQDSVENSIKKYLNRQDVIDESHRSLADNVEECEETVLKDDVKNQSLTSRINEAKALNRSLQGEVTKKQEIYMEQAEARLQLQKTMAKMLVLIQERVTDKSMVEEIVVTALGAETEAKSVMAGLDVETSESHHDEVDILEEAEPGA
jgi:myosin-5